VRDYADVAAIALDGRWTPEQIMDMGAQNDPGFDRSEFARFLDPEYVRFPSSRRCHQLGIDRATEGRMCDALRALRAAALGEGPAPSS
jgi:hypothetical protein